MEQLSTSLPHIKSGKLRPLLAIRPQRVAEAGGGCAHEASIGGLARMGLLKPE